MVPSSFKLFTQRIVSTVGIALCSAMLFTGCASTQGIASNNDRLVALCTTQDLRQVAQRTVLAGGYFALEKNDLPCAERLTLDAREKNLKDAYATLNLGAIYQRTGRLSQAKDMYSKTIELDGGNKDQDKAPESHVATNDKQKSKRPTDIAKYNLALLEK
jgi:Flp pilus assembly protein TadD